MIPHVTAPLSEGTMTPTETASGRLAPAARLTVAVIAACPFPARRGTPVRIQRLAEELTQRGHRVVVVTYHHGTGEADPTVEVRRIRPIRSYNKLGPGPSYRKLLLLDPMLMVKLAGILRVANALDAEHAQKITDVRAVRRASTWIVELQGAGDLTMERLAATARSDMFAETFGRPLVIQVQGAVL